MRPETYALISKVLGRIEQRRGLLEDAKLIYEEARAATAEGIAVVEEVPGGTLCKTENPGENAQTVFFCTPSKEGDGFSCPPQENYDADTFCSNMPAKPDFKTCGTVVDKDFECNSTDDPPFSCDNSGGSPADYFDCYAFECNDKEGSEGSFDCDADVDFYCGGLTDFECEVDFKCTAGHGFFCKNENECTDIFACKGGETCQKEPTTAVFTCDPDKAPGVITGYGTSTTPGDFKCGTNATPPPEEHDCEDTFNCDGEAHFLCLKGAVFECGGNEEGSSFACAYWGPHVFLCFTEFKCIQEAEVDCNGGTPAVDEYNCGQVPDAVYTQPPYEP